MRVLVLDSALGRCAAAVVTDGAVTASRVGDHKTGHEAVLPAMARDVLAEAGGRIDLIGVVVGPGSFTGIRAAVALAHGIGTAFCVPVEGVTAGEAIADALPPLAGRALWTVTDSRRDHLFLEIGGGAMSAACDALPMPEGPVAVAGPAADRAAAWLAARDANVMLTPLRFPSEVSIARVAERRLAGAIPPRAAQPLYVDPPRVTLPLARGQSVT